MRVNISHSVELAEVPQSVKDLLISRIDLTELEGQYRKVLDGLDSISSAHSAAVSVENVSSLRQELFKVDSLLQDCMNILSGYAQAVSEQTSPGLTLNPAPQSADVEVADE